MKILEKLKSIRGEKLDTGQAKTGVSWVVRVAQAVGAVVVLGLIIWVLLPPKVENPAPIVVEKEVPVTKEVLVTVEVEKRVVQTVVVEKKAVAPTPVLVTPTPSKPSCPLRGKLADGKVIICLRCYSREDGDKCDYRVEGMSGGGFYTNDADKVLENLVWWEPVAEESLILVPTVNSPDIVDAIAAVVAATPQIFAPEEKKQVLCWQGELKDSRMFCCIDWDVDDNGNLFHKCLFEDGERNDKVSHDWLMANSVFWTECSLPCGW